MARRGRSRSFDTERSRGRSSQGDELYIYGINPVAEALKSGDRILSVFIHNQTARQQKSLVDLAASRRIPVKYVERDFFDARFDKGHQGIAAAVNPKKTVDIDDLLDISFSEKNSPFFLVLDCIEDPRNLGAILRIADAAGCDGVVYQSRRSASLTPTVYKSSAGAIEHVNLSEVVNIKHAITRMKERDVTIIGAEADSPMNLWEADMKGPLAIIVGSEGEGMRHTVREMCDIVVKLPMKGTVNSLNVSVAAGVLSYEVMRQRSR